MQFHNDPFRRCARAWKKQLETDISPWEMPSQNMLIWQIHKRLSSVDEAWRIPMYLGIWFVSLLKTREKEWLLPTHRNRELGSGETSGLPHAANLILSAPSLTMHLKLIGGEMSHLITFNHEHDQLHAILTPLLHSQCPLLLFFKERDL